MNSNKYIYVCKKIDLRFLCSQFRYVSDVWKYKYYDRTATGTDNRGMKRKVVVSRHFK